VTEKVRPKATSYEYGPGYQLAQLSKYRNRHNNHWGIKIELARDLVARYVRPRLREKPNSDIVVVDLGCSIGTFAIEFAKLGYRCYGVDFDPAALKIARQLSAEENVSVEFVQADVADWKRECPPVDIAICSDIFEHLHDDELGALLQSVRKQLSQAGSLVFHTFPTQYDYLFFSRSYVRWPLLLVKDLPADTFERVARAYASVIDVWLLLAKGHTYHDSLKSAVHCNPLTKERLTDLLERAGYEVLCIETAQLYPFKDAVQKQFLKHPISYRNLYGVAVPKAYGSV